MKQNQQWNRLPQKAKDMISESLTFSIPMVIIIALLIINIPRILVSYFSLEFKYINTVIKILLAGYVLTIFFILRYRYKKMYNRDLNADFHQAVYGVPQKPLTIGESLWALKYIFLFWIPLAICIYFFYKVEEPTPLLIFLMIGLSLAPFVCLIIEQNVNRNKH